MPVGGPQLPPSAAQLDFARRFDAAYADAVNKYNAFVASLGSLQTSLRAAGLKPLNGVKTATP